MPMTFLYTGGTGDPQPQVREPKLLNSLGEQRWKNPERKQLLPGVLTCRSLYVHHIRGTALGTFIYIISSASHCYHQL